MTDRSESADAAFMRRALALAERGRGGTSPNPMVGALVVSPDGVIVGRGWHRRAGEPHAEILALEEAGPRARGATLYCTLEPCCHVGRTGPCVDRIIEAGVRRVVAAMADPNPRVAGGGLRRLREGGLDVVEGVLAAEAARLNAAFLTWIRTGRPHVTMKIALSLDGFVAAAGGRPCRLTGPEADRLVHRDRAAVDALAVGSGTILADDPLLTARGAWRGRPLARVIFDRRLRTPPTARVLSTLEVGPVIIVTDRPDPPAAARRALEAAGAEILVAPGGIARALALLGDREMTSILVEGGPALHAAFWRAGVVDAVQVYVTPVVLGTGIAWLPPEDIWLSALHGARVRPCGADVRLDGDILRPGGGRDDVHGAD
ncbi:MAG TPA: bifunctional diaminohydroxyphosphoribosylaminopyrimidine deaminase/5-amino-6-(5-phosphoribosylamino)uracil reductase RibD [Vicinamibacterales bacterium]|nr:bifunctional diaminohydroxyphosphoribosylaminopyrimidine deaminase/5-amino-6-(5-phosphoribosylamino)uracil reductase RibD [Vicinamibacterales bacterium]